MPRDTRDQYNEHDDKLKESADEVLDTDDSSTPFKKDEVITAIVSRLRMKPKKKQQRILQGYGQEIDRRQFLKILGFAAGGAVIAGGTGKLMNRIVFSDSPQTVTGRISALQELDGVERVAGDGDVTDEGDYMVIEQESDLVITIADGGELSNILIRVNGNNMNITATQSTFELANIGVEGEIQDRCGQSNISCGATNEALMDNIYLGDGGAGTHEDHGSCPPTEGPPTGLWATNNTGGMVMRCMNVSQFPDNAFYLASQGDAGNNTWEDCYVYDTGVDAFRVEEGTHELHNCHVENMRPPTGRDFRISADHTSGGATVDCYDCQFGGGGSGLVATGTGQINLHNCQYGATRGNVNPDSDSGTNPQPEIPDCVPGDAEAAASGDGGGDFTPGDGASNGNGNGNGDIC